MSERSLRFPSRLPWARGDVGRRLQRGDPDALDRLVAEFRPVLLAYLTSVLRDRAEAEDVLQQVLLEAWRRSDQYDPQRASVRNWLLLLCRSRAIDRLRRRVPEPRDPSGLLTLEEASADDATDALLERWRIVDLLRRLPARERELLRLRFYEELTQEEIAERLGMPLGTVKSASVRALRGLRQLVDEEDTG